MFWFTRQSNVDTVNAVKSMTKFIWLPHSRCDFLIAQICKVKLTTWRVEFFQWQVGSQISRKIFNYYLMAFYIIQPGIALEITSKTSWVFQFKHFQGFNIVFSRINPISLPYMFRGILSKTLLRVPLRIKPVISPKISPGQGYWYSPRTTRNRLPLLNAFGKTRAKQYSRMNEPIASSGGLWEPSAGRVFAHFATQSGSILTTLRGMLRSGKSASSNDGSLRVLVNARRESLRTGS